MRLTSTTPLQALFLLNDPFTHQQAGKLTDRLLQARPEDKARVSYAYQLMFARLPIADEQASGTTYLNKARTLLRDAATSSDALDHLAWQSYVRSLLSLNEFVYID